MLCAALNQALHARLLGFVHPTTGKRVRFEAAVPVDFASALESLRSS
jgi:23S rRNA pseudouridine1911/1915/1917 synthase